MRKIEIFLSVMLVFSLSAKAEITMDAYSELMSADSMNEQQMEQYHRALAKEMAVMMNDPQFRDVLFKKLENAKEEKEQMLMSAYDDADRIMISDGAPAIESIQQDDRIPKVESNNFGVPVTELMSSYLSSIPEGMMAAEEMDKMNQVASFASHLDKMYIQSKGLENELSNLLELRYVVPPNYKKDASIQETKGNFEKLMVAYLPAGDDTQKKIYKRKEWDKDKKKWIKYEQQSAKAWSEFEAFDQSGKAYKFDVNDESAMSEPLVVLGNDEQRHLDVSLPNLNRAIFNATARFLGSSVREQFKSDDGSFEQGPSAKEFMQRRMIQQAGLADSEGAMEHVASSDIGEITFSFARGIQVKVNDDKEPWIKGPAEMYMMVASICSEKIQETVEKMAAKFWACTPLAPQRGNKHRTDLVTVANSPDGFDVDRNMSNYEKRPNKIALDYLDYSGQWYQMKDEIVYYWDRSNLWEFSAVMFEADSGADFGQFAKNLAKIAEDTSFLHPYGAFTYAGAKLTNAIIDSMPQSFWIDDDDFVDKIPSIKFNDFPARKNMRGSKKKYKGTSNNLTIELQNSVISTHNSQGKEKKGVIDIIYDWFTGWFED